MIMWVIDEDLGQVAMSGEVEIGSVRRSDASGRWRWEIVALPSHVVFRDERHGWLDTEAEAKAKVVEQWTGWLDKAGLADARPPMDGAPGVDVSRLKVYGGCFDGTNRLIVAAPTKKAAVEAINAAGKNLSMHAFNQFAGITGNKDDLRIALSKPGTVFSQNLRRRGETYVEVSKG